MISGRNLCISTSLATTLFLMGCFGGPPPVEIPAWNPPEQAAKAMTLYDKNADGQIAPDELSPGLKSALGSIDTDKNGSISEQELVDRIQAFADTKLGLIGVQGTARYAGRPLAGATITYEPEPFLAGVIKPAKATVGKDGFFSLRTEGEQFDATQPGIYLVRVSKPSDSGRETLPAKFNEETELGADVGREETTENRGAGEFDLNL